MPAQDQTLAETDPAEMPPDIPGRLTPSEEAGLAACRQRDIQRILHEFHAERDAQYAQWGVQDIPLGFGGRLARQISDGFRRECDEAHERGDLTMRHILLEEFYEALAEHDLKSARDELIQVGACVVQAIQIIDKELAGA